MLLIHAQEYSEFNRQLMVASVEVVAGHIYYELTCQEQFNQSSQLQPHEVDTIIILILQINNNL